ncbi:uncharacterized protein involved in exopolysaccharide biosynthesis [Hoeflea halophila]|uniref:Uncharacterized protein involved in exopolysaccharide biosynthesis n=1 Tax=Hoeflea halophila TaxID=714899 RepID=A0A286IDV8_9HYPH|nr:GumC family protein [Hoeflea halophila]SOE18207.1 uncharacterized protein involved in exopolysaccharide biosynthesis [Hoeflea halophila]
MSDSTDDRRPRGGRGSLLDHARDSGVSRTGQPAGPQPADRPRAAPSILSTPNRSARVSTSRFSAPRDDAPDRAAGSVLASAPANDPAPTVAAEAQPGKSAEPASATREKFGDRIARLIGTIAPDENSGTRRQQSGNQQPVASGASPEADRRPEAPLQSEAEPEPEKVPDSGRHPRRDIQFRDDPYHWHAASGHSQLVDDTRPLLDASILISAVWRFRRLIGAATVGGAVIGVLLALSTPHKYYAESRLFVDPREVRVTEDDIRNQQLSTEAMLAITDSQLQILSSTSVLEKVVSDLGLDRDPEFNGSRSAGGISGGISLIRELFTGKSPSDEGEQKALNNLRDALSVSRDSRTFVIIVGVDTRDAEKSALIANRVVETYLDSEGQAQSSLLERTSESIDTRLNALRADLDAAEREVERFKAENGLVGVGGQFIDDKEILALSDQLANARAMKVGIRVKADNLAKVRIDDVLSGAFPEELLSSNLSELRKQYTQTKANADSLATRLGPRHPQYIAAMQSLETITNEISAELRRIVASSQTELQRAVATEQELASQMAIAKSRSMDQSVELVTLRELERKANATRGIYEAFLTRSRETSERSNLSTRNVRVISPAEAPMRPMGPSRKIIAIGGMMAGLFAGLGLALLAGAVESIRAYNSAQLPNRYPGSPFGGYPQPPAPAPRTPPGGPGRPSGPGPDDSMSGGRESIAGGFTPAPFTGARASAAAAAGARMGKAPVEEPSGKSEPQTLDSMEAVPVPPAPARTIVLRPKSARAGASGTSRAAPSSEPAPSGRARKAEKPDAEQTASPAWLEAVARILSEAGDHVEQPPASEKKTALSGEAPRARDARYEPALAPDAHARAPEPVSVAAPDSHNVQPAEQSCPVQTQTPHQPQPQFHPQAPHAPHAFAAPAPAQAIYPSHSVYYQAPQPQISHFPGLHHGRAVDPYAPVYPVHGVPVAPYAAAAAYPMLPPQMMPMQPHQFQPAYQPQPVPVQPHAQSHPAPVHAYQQVPPQPVPAAAPPARAAPATEPARSEPPVSNEQVDRIRREMNELRSRIDGYAAPRRSA